MRTAVRRMGNSQGVIIPKTALVELGVKAGDKVDMKIIRGRLVISAVCGDPRAGWAEECKVLAEAGEDGLIWPEFGNKDDEKLAWR